MKILNLPRSSFIHPVIHVNEQSSVATLIIKISCKIIAKRQLASPRSKRAESAVETRTRCDLIELQLPLCASRSLKSSELWLRAAGADWYLPEVLVLFFFFEENCGVDEDACWIIAMRSINYSWSSFLTPFFFLFMVMVLRRIKSVWFLCSERTLLISCYKYWQYWGYRKQKQVWFISRFFIFAKKIV